VWVVTHRGSEAHSKRRAGKASVYDFLRSERAAAVEPSFSESSCPATAPQLPTTSTASSGMSEMTPFWSLPIWEDFFTYMGGLLRRRMFGRADARHGGDGRSEADVEGRRPDLLVLAARGDEAIGRLTLPARSS
jgi:hypothetical protein